MLFILDRIFPDHPFTIQFNKVVTICPMLRERFLGVSTSAKNPSTHKEPSNAVDSSRTSIELIRVGNYLQYIKQEHTEADIPHVIQAYHSEYGTSLSAGMMFQCLYWVKIRARCNDDSHSRRVSLCVLSFEGRALSFYEIAKIIMLRHQQNNISVRAEWLCQSGRAPSEPSETPRWRITPRPASIQCVVFHIAL